jgi:biotin synthase
MARKVNMPNSILERINKDSILTKEDAIELLRIKNTSEDFYRLLSIANELTRTQYNNKAYIFAQIGMNSAPCSGNCKFCSLARDFFSVDTQFEKNEEQIVSEAKAVAGENIEALFLMTTADYDKEKFLSIGQSVRNNIPQKVQLIANVGDFDNGYAQKLKSAGFSGAYHVVRLREGVDTGKGKNARIATLDAIRSTGLELYYCVEPIGPEHSYEEIADEMIRARKYDVNVMAVMGRVNVPGTPFDGKDALSELELTKIAAVTRIVVNPKKSMNIHEPKKMPLLAGVNQLYAEYGSNPRDTNSKTDISRGFNIEGVKAMLLDAEYDIF